VFKGITQSLRSLFSYFLQVFLNDCVGKFGENVPENFTFFFLWSSSIRNQPARQPARQPPTINPPTHNPNSPSNA
jgi:hypothetical protein